MKRPRGFRHEAPQPEAEPEFEAVDAPVQEPLPEPVPQPTQLPPEPASAPEVSEVIGLDADLQETQEITEFVSDRARLKGAGTAALAVVRRPADAEYREAKRELKHAERNRKRRERQERYRFSKHQRARRRRMMIVLGAVSALCLAVIVGVFTPLMAVSTIEVRGADRLAPEMISESLSHLTGTPLALVSDEAVREGLQDLTLLQHFAIEKVPPHTLRVVVTERQPVMAVPRGDELLLVDPAGVQIETVPKTERPAGIPVVQGIGTELESAEFIAMATVLRAMPGELRAEIAEISAATTQQISLVMVDGLPIMWGDTSSSSQKSVVLRSMLEALADISLRSIDVSSPDSPVYVPA